MLDTGLLMHDLFLQYRKKLIQVRNSLKLSFSKLIPIFKRQQQQQKTIYRFFLILA